MTDDYEYHQNKRPDKTYISKSLAFSTQADRRFRIASKVIDSPECHSFALEKGEHVIRVTHGGRQEIVAKFYEDTRGVHTLTLQRFTTDTGAPHKTYFSFIGNEIRKLLEFISNLQLVQFPNQERVNVTDAQLKRMLLAPDQVRTLLVQNQDAVLELARSDITKGDIVALGYRRKQLERFEKLLSDSDYFETERREANCSAEALWQKFFEKNKWIFGYGLTYLFVSGLDDRTLEQVVVGYDLGTRGKRADAVMKTRGAIEALCLVEIKKHTTDLLQEEPYRRGCYAASEEMAGGISQVQATAALAARKLASKLELKDEDGNPSGETIFTHQPRSFLVIGNLGQFEAEHGINEDKYRSFELFRRNVTNPEILTFDELYHRARFIVEHAES
jgi:hypothetical protein